MAAINLVNPKRKRKKKRVHAKRRVARVSANPRKKRRAAAPKRKRARRRVGVVARAARTVRRRSRRSGGFRGGRGIMGVVKGTVMPAAVGAAGAIVTDLVLGFLPLPDMVKTGPLRIVTQLAAAVGIGMAFSKFTNRNIGNSVTLGGVTVALYKPMLSTLASVAPNLPLAGIDTDYRALEFMSAGYPAGVGEYVNSGVVMPVGMGEYQGQY